jgi:hypothetical protein
MGMTTIIATSTTIMSMTIIMRTGTITTITIMATVMGISIPTASKR